MTETQRAPLVARVLLDTPLPQLDHLFDYAVPEELREEIKAGQRVKVPFRSRQRDVLGYVVEIVEESEFGGSLATLSQIVTPVQLLTAEVWQLARAVADRAGGSAGDILRLAIPPRQVRAEKAYFAALQECEAPDPQPVKSDDALTETARRLTGGERLYLDVAEPPARLASGEWVLAWAKIMCQTAISLQEAGKSAIIVVPDFRDVDQVLDTLTSLQAQGVVRLDTRQSVGDRYKQFLQTLESTPKIIVGNRSAVYAPAHDLGAIMIWDEADASLDEPLTPYVTARDAALVRASQSGAGLLFAGHARSAQVQRLLDMGYFAANRYGGMRPTVIHSGALTRQEEQSGRIPEIATRILRKGLKEGPVLVQVATAGFAPILVCARCGDMAKCRHCSGALASSKMRGVACRLCADTNRNWRCETCGETKFEARGAGSERTAEQFEKIFAGVNIILSDGAHMRMRVDARPALVVATRGAEPIAMGGYRAVVILDADRYLASWHLSAGEDALRWWRNAVAFAAEGADCVIAGGGGPVLQTFVQGRDEEWLRGELVDRHDLRFPPAVRVASLTGTHEAVSQAIATVADISGVDVLGPARLEDGQERAIVRFDYGQGSLVAKRLRAELLRGIAQRSAKRHVQAKAREQRGQGAVALRLRFDDETVFDDRGE